MANIKMINKADMAAKGESIYARLKEKLEQEHRDEFVAIEVDSGDYFLGRTLQEADKKAREKYPDRVFYVIRIGRRAVWVRR
jgi:hypothetical protein